MWNFPAEGIGQRVNSGGVDRAETQPAVKTAERERGAGFDVVAVADGANEIFGNQFDALQRVNVHDGMRKFIGVGFDAMRQRVEAGCGGNGRWNGHRQQWIHKCGVGHKVRTDDAFFQFVGFIQQNGVRRNFRAGAGGRRQADQRQFAFGTKD